MIMEVSKTLQYTGINKSVLGGVLPHSRSTRKAGGGKVRYSNLRLLPCHHLRHDSGRHWSQKNTIAKMAGCHKISWRRSFAENRQPVGCSRAQSRPRFVN